MKKLYLAIGMILFLALYSNITFAEYCDSHMRNLNFFAVAIGKDKKATCSYRYCYYSCIYDSYTIPGHFKPGYGSWTMKEDGIYVCHDFFSSACGFLYDLTSSKYF